MIRAIVAIDDRRGIAAHGAIPWSIPSDSRYFREQTEGGVVLMGAATYQEFDRPLPNRRNLVASRELITVREGFELIQDVDSFLAQTKDDVWIIGGAGLYASTLKYCEELYLTHVSGDFDCDRFFPNYQQSYRLIERSLDQAENGHQYYFAVYKKNR